MRRAFSLRPPVIVGVAVLALGLTSCAQATPRRLSRTTTSAPPIASGHIPWWEDGTWLAADIHTHSVFSDGAWELAEVVRAGARNGCDVMAVTDHATPELLRNWDRYVDSIEEARRDNPSVLVFAGAEWNMPPYEGDVHATVLVSTERAEREMLPSFLRSYDHFVSPERWPAGRELDIRESFPPGGREGLVILNHPSRTLADETALQELVDHARRAGVHHVAAAPGHQNAEHPGHYAGGLPVDGRWDPVVRANGVWDGALTRGETLLSALASSDFHDTERGDREPCSYSRTWVRAARSDRESFLEALARGTMVATLGAMDHRPMLQAQGSGSAPARVGETLVHRGEPVQIEVLDVPSGVGVELVVIASGGSETVSMAAHERSVSVRRTLGRDVLALRARGVSDDGSLGFVTNPIHVEWRR